MDKAEYEETMKRAAQARAETDALLAQARRDEYRGIKTDDEALAHLVERLMEAHTKTKSKRQAALLRQAALTIKKLAAARKGANNG